MELSELECFHFLYRSLWSQNTDERVVRHKVNIMDTIIFLQGFPVRWLFTSEKTGEVLRKKDMKPKDIITSLKSRATKLRTTDKNYAKSLNRKGGTCFSVVWYKNEAGKMDFYRLDEHQLMHMLKERIFTQAMVAVQVYFDPMPFKGSGIFEHHYNSQMLRNVGAHKTYELLETPSSPNFFDMHERIVEQGTYEEFAQSQSQAHQVLRPDQATKRVNREMTSITETQHNLIKVSVTKLIKLMEALVGGKIHQATFVFYFNENWSPFVVATKNVIVQATISTARILMYTGDTDILDTTAASPPPSSPYVTDKRKKGKDRKIVKGFRSLKHLSSNAHTHSSSVRSDSDSDHSSDYFSDDDQRNVVPNKQPGNRRGSTMPNKASSTTTTNSASKLQPDDANFIPPPHPGKPASTMPYSKGECSPDNKPKRREGLAVRTTALQKILADATRNETKVQFSDTSERVPNTTAHGTSGTKAYMMNTEQSNLKIQAYKSEVCGKDPNSLSNRRPINAPYGTKKSSALLDYGGYGDHDPFATADLRDGRFQGTAEGKLQSQNQKTFRKKLLLQKDTCFGDYCGILCKYLEEWEIDDSLVKIKDMHGKEKLKSTKIFGQIPTKSIYLCRSEVAYSGFDIALQENLECLGHDRVDILTACAKNHINNISDKCRREALLPLLSMAQLKATKNLPDMKEMLIAAFVYRNLVYNEALSKVHPSRFYYTAPVCDVCNDIYTALDETRAKVIYRKPNLHKMSSGALRELDTQSHTLGDPDSSGSFEARIYRARENLRRQAEQNRADRGNSAACENNNNHDHNNNGNDNDNENYEEGSGGFKKSLDSSKIPWESNFMFEMNALQQGSVVLGGAPVTGVSMEESIFLEETDALAEHMQQQSGHEDLNHQHQQQHEHQRREAMNRPASERALHKEGLPDTGVVSQPLPLQKYQQSMTALLNPTLGKGEEVQPEDVQRGVLKSKSQHVLQPASTTIAANTFSSWANLLDAANHKGKRRKQKKGFKLRTSYKNNPAAEQKRKEVLENRRLDRQHELWTSGLHNPNVKLGATTNTQTGTATNRPKSASASRMKASSRRPQSAGATRTRKPTTTSGADMAHTHTRYNQDYGCGHGDGYEQQRQQQQQHGTNQHDHDNYNHNDRHRHGREDSRTGMHYFASPPKGATGAGIGAQERCFELETPEDVREFNDIKVDILKHRGLHSVPVRQHATQVLCGGEFTQVVLAPPSLEEGSSLVSPQVMPPHEDVGGGSGSASASAFTSVNLLDTSSSALFVPQVYSYPTATPTPTATAAVSATAAVTREQQQENAPPPHGQLHQQKNSPQKQKQNQQKKTQTPHDEGGGDVQLFVSELLKHSPMSPQNINYSLMQNTQISNEVKKMIDELGEEKE